MDMEDDGVVGWEWGIGNEIFELSWKILVLLTETVKLWKQIYSRKKDDEFYFGYAEFGMPLDYSGGDVQQIVWEVGLNSMK